MLVHCLAIGGIYQKITTIPGLVAVMKSIVVMLNNSINVIPSVRGSAPLSGIRTEARMPRSEGEQR